jgi:hypothetical protein
MTIRSISLMAASSILGSQVHGVYLSSDMSPQYISATSTSATYPPMTTPTYFSTRWMVPPNITLGENVIFSYTFTNELDETLELVLCQTNATGALDSLNTWTVGQVTGKCNPVQIHIRENSLNRVRALHRQQ